jgi:cytochrome c oxidase assembly factor CtaG
VLFWSQAIPSLPWKPRLSYIGQAVYFSLAMLWGNVLGFAFVDAMTPLYPYYASLTTAANAVSDLHLAGGVMDVADSFIFISVAIAALALWLADDERRQAAMDAQIAASRLASAQTPTSQVSRS